MILAIQICCISAAKGQKQSAEQDLLVAPLPELLMSESGLSIESTVHWEEIRRPEILDLFRDHVYGRVPESDARVKYRLVFEDREALQGTAKPVAGAGDAVKPASGYTHIAQKEL